MRITRCVVIQVEYAGRLGGEGRGTLRLRRGYATAGMRTHFRFSRELPMYCRSDLPT